MEIVLDAKIARSSQGMNVVKEEMGYHFAEK